MKNKKNQPSTKSKRVVVKKGKPPSSITRKVVTYKGNRATGNDPFFEKGLPSDLESERSVLGAILLDSFGKSGHIIDQAIELLRRQDFFLESHRRIFERMISVHEQQLPIDMITLGGELRRFGELEQIGGGSYLSSLIDGVPRTDTIEYYARLIKDKSQLRQFITFANKIIELCFEEEDLGKVLTFAQTELLSLLPFNSGGRIYSAKEGADEFAEELRIRAENPGALIGLPTGLNDFDARLGGLRQGYYTIAGRPSMGKTSLAVGVGLYAAKKNYIVFHKSYEMKAKRTVERYIAAIARVNATRLRHADLDKEEWERVADALDTFENLPIHIDDTGGETWLDIRSSVRQFILKHGKLDLLIIDYLDLMASLRSDGLTAETTEKSNGLVQISIEFDLPIIVLVQLNRECERRKDGQGGHRPILSDLRNTGAVEQDSDVVTFVYRDEVYNQTDLNKGIAELITAKNRDGVTGVDRVVYSAPIMHFDNLWRPISSKTPRKDDDDE